MKLHIALVAAIFGLMSGAVMAGDAPSANASDSAKAKSHGQQGALSSGRLSLDYVVTDDGSVEIVEEEATTSVSTTDTSGTTNSGGTMDQTMTTFTF